MSSLVRFIVGVPGTIADYVTPVMARDYWRTAIRILPITVSVRQSDKAFVLAGEPTRLSQVKVDRLLVAI